MDARNLEEYKLVRAELEKLKECITTYMGFVIGGSGAAFFGLAAVKSGNGVNYLLVYIPLALSIIVSLVLLVLFYKFNSHNRGAAYCKILGQEFVARADREGVGVINIILWESCMEILRASDADPSYLSRTLSKAEIEGLEPEAERILERISGKAPSIDRWKFPSGMKIIIATLLGRTVGSSWAFPAYIVGVFLFLIVVFLAVGVISATVAIEDSQISAFDRRLVTLSAGATVTVQLYLWLTFAGKLHTLMVGSSTISAFCWKFLPLRAHLLNRLGFRPSYRYDELPETGKADES